MPKPKHARKADAEIHSDLMNDAAELIQPALVKPVPGLPAFPMIAGSTVLATIRKKIGPISPSPEWAKMRKALDARDKALEKYQAEWYDTSEGKALEAAADKARNEYYRVRKQTT